MQKAQAGARAFLGMELHADGTTRAYDSRESVILVRAPCTNDRVIDRPAHVAVRVIGVREGGTHKQLIVRGVDGIPPDLRDALRSESGDRSRKDLQTSRVRRAFVARVEQQLHAETDAKTRQPVTQGRLHGESTGRQALCG